MNKKVFFRTLFILSIILNIGLIGFAGFYYYKNIRNRNVFELNTYAYANSQLESPTVGENRVIFLGNSITENWVHLRYKFFADNKYICRGLSGQTSALLLLRFRQDVIDLKPDVVVINAGINDIAENTGTYHMDFTIDNIRSMAQLAEINGIKVILTSVLPCAGKGWKGHIGNVPAKIDELNVLIKNFAVERNYSYIDYNTSMRNEKGGLIDTYTFDELHPNEEGYKIMEPLVQAAINNVLNKTE